ncbi:hypothetical protein CHARACLAT_010229 [Characodon lateralis]|uniref:Uncharacterized protein n=1 Tax=Characodon lateralis TaxID=208331 RepID=A0ABU7DTX1_9TELE|nr:hypothetical protein [Characodon lateralis]
MAGRFSLHVIQSHHGVNGYPASHHPLHYTPLPPPSSLLSLFLLAGRRSENTGFYFSATIECDIDRIRKARNPKPSS